MSYRVNPFTGQFDDDGVKVFASMAEAPSAAAYGVGPAWIGGRQFWSDAIKWSQGFKRQSSIDNTVYVLGDSFDVRSMPVLSSTNWQTAHYGMFNIMNMLLGNALFPVGIDGISGTGALAGTNYGVNSARLDAAIASGAKYLFVRASVNDPNNSYTASQMISAYGGIFSAANAAGMTVICANICPNNLYSGTAVKLKAALYFNLWLQQKATELYDVIVLPMEWPTMDDDATNFSPKTTTGYSEDGTHPDATLAFRLAQVHAAILSPIIGRQAHVYSTVASTAAASPNPCNAGTDGTKNAGVTGSVASSMQVGQTSGTPTACVASKVARTDAPGYWQKVVWTPSTSGRFLQYSVASAVPVNSDLAVGDVISVCHEIHIPDTVTAADVAFATSGTTFQGSTGTYNETWGLYTSSSRNWATSGWTGVIASPPIAIPVGTTQMWAGCRVMSANTNEIEVQFGQHWIINYSLLDRL